MSEDIIPTELALGAIAAHETMVSFIDAGFTREEAFDIIKSMVLKAVEN